MQRANLSIVMADDHQLILEGMRTALGKQHDFTIVAEATNGRELIDAVKRFLPDIVITDINMPVLDGVQATKIIKSRYPATGIIGLSFMDTAFSIVEMLEAGALGYISKGSGIAGLAEAIRAVHSGTPYYCPSTSAFLGWRIAQSSFNPYKTFRPVFTSQEVRIIRAISLGKSSREISDLLSIKLRTVDAHRRNILDKLKIKSAVGIIIYAIKNQIVREKELPAIIEDGNL